MRRIIVAVLIAVIAAPLHAWTLVPCRVKTFVRNVRNDEKRVCHQADAGSAHVAVLSVAPWEEYVTSLQPLFSMTIDDAMREVLPATSTMEETVLRAFLASVEAALPTTTSTKTTTKKVDAAGAVTKTSDATATEATGDVTQVPDAPARTAPTFTTDVATIAGALPVDPMLRRLAALALFQETQILSRHVVDAGMRQDYRPYVVRFQVTLLPNARREPYDAYTTVTFLPGLTSKATDAEQESYNTIVKDKQAVVIPLLVTDNIESTRRADLSQQVRDLSAAVLAMTGGVGISAGARSQLNHLSKSQSNDFNSLLTVARISDSSLRVRLGAVQGNDRFTMIPRTHNVTVLVLVPLQAETMRYIAKSTMHDAIHGTPLTPKRNGDFKYEDVAEEWIEGYELPEDIGYYTELVPLAQAGDYDGFRTHLINSVMPDAHCDSRCKLLPPKEHAYWNARAIPQNAQNQRQKNGRASSANVTCDCNALRIHFGGEVFRENVVQRIWADVVNYNSMDQHTEGRFDLPKPLHAHRRFYQVDDVSPVDHAGAFTSVRLHGARFVEPSRLRARLRVDTGQGVFYLDASSITSRTGDDAEIRFPSVTKLLKVNSTATGPRSALLLSYASSPFRWDHVPPFGSSAGIAAQDVVDLNGGREIAFPIASFVIDEEKKDPSPGFTISAATPFVMVGKDPTKIRFTVTKAADGAPDRVFFSVSGADIAEITPAPGLEKNQMFATENATYTATLTNITNLSDVIISAFSIKDKKRLPVNDLRIRVVETPKVAEKEKEKS